MSTEKAAGAAGAAQAGEGNLLDEILSLTPMKPTDDGYALTQKGVQAFISNMLTSGKSADRIDNSATSPSAWSHGSQFTAGPPRRTAGTVRRTMRGRAA